MVVTRRGAAGVCVASHVTEELRLALVSAPRALGGHWDQLHNHKDVTGLNVLVRSLFVYYKYF